MPITIGNWHYSRIRVIGNVVDSITETREKTITIIFYNDIKKCKFTSNEKMLLLKAKKSLWLVTI